MCVGEEKQPPEMDLGQMINHNKDTKGRLLWLQSLGRPSEPQ